MLYHDRKYYEIRPLHLWEGFSGFFFVVVVFFKQYSVIMFGLFMCQLALIIYIWVQRAQFLDSMDQVITTIWNQHKTDQQVMDTLQISVSKTHIINKTTT